MVEVHRGLWAVSPHAGHSDKPSRMRCGAKCHYFPQQRQARGYLLSHRASPPLANTKLYWLVTTAHVYKLNINNLLNVVSLYIEVELLGLGLGLVELASCDLSIASHIR